MKRSFISTTLATLVLTLLVLTTTTTTTAKVTIPTLEQCTPAYAGIGQTCHPGSFIDRQVECLGESYCVQQASYSTASGICYPKQVFIGQECKHHYECYKALLSDKNIAVYCDQRLDQKCKFTREVGETCEENVECQTQYCNEQSKVCEMRKEGAQCESKLDCLPFDTDKELLMCDTSNTKQCLAKATLNQACNATIQCESRYYCHEEKCVAYKQVNEDCSTGGIPCDPSGDGVDVLTCIENTCQYPKHLREKYTTTVNCLTSHALSKDTTYGVCKNTRCFRHQDCGSDLNYFCDCTNLICQNRSYGNKVQQCLFINGTNKPRLSAYEKCMKENCKTSAFVDSVVQLNKKSCAYKKCRKAYLETADCLRRAGETYGAKDMYFF